MPQNPYQPPQGESEIDAAQDVSAENDVRAIACYPLPFLAALFSWFTYPFLFFSIPLPVIPIFVSLGSIFWSADLTRRIVTSSRLPSSSTWILIGIYVFAILAAWPLGIELYLFLGFPEPMP